VVGVGDLQQAGAVDEHRHPAAVQELQQWREPRVAEVAAVAPTGAPPRTVRSGPRRWTANGNAALADQAVPLTAGIADAADGARQLDDDVREADSGAHQLADGATRLSDGTVTVDDGARQLATSLNEGRDQVPGYTDEERAHLETVAADPTTATIDSTTSGTARVTM
jgi:putative membrane protein